MHLHFRNVNEAFQSLVKGIHEGRIETDIEPSRYGEVMSIPDPVTITYTHPRERVLFNSARDCNPFFFLYESLWMLAGRQDLPPLVYYASKMAEFTDDGGKTMPDAYGYRWRVFYGRDQLNEIIDALHNNPHCRRQVLSMWNCYTDPIAAKCGSKGVPCNISALFRVADGKLNMTVFNRSNDLILGSLGANVVHFSFLQEYMACSLGLEVGKYHQISNNLHTYTAGWAPEKWFPAQRDMHSAPRTDYARDVEDKTVNDWVTPGPLLVKDKEAFDIEVKEFTHWFDGTKTSFPLDLKFSEPFLQDVALPMMLAFYNHKQRYYEAAAGQMRFVQAADWKDAGCAWLNKRELNWSNKNATPSAGPTQGIAEVVKGTTADSP